MRGLLRHYGNNLTRALMELFPNIGLEKKKLLMLAPFQYTDKRREFFLKFARDHEFDPLDPENWYLVSRKDLLSTKGGYGIWWHYPSLSRALIELFPEVKFDRTKLFSRRKRVALHG